MKKQPDKATRVNEMLESLEGIRRAEPAPFFFTRVRARLEAEKHNIWETTGSFMSRPIVAFAGLFFILCINAFILFKKDSRTIEPPSVSIATTMPVEEYVLTAANSNYDYENLEP